MTWSIRGRLLLSVIGAMAVLQIGLATLVYEVMERAFGSDFDAVLAATARTLSGAVEQDGQNVRADVDEREFPEFRRASQPDYYQVWLDDGQVLARSSSLKGGDLERAESTIGAVTFRRVRLPDGHSGRAAVLHFEPRMDDDGQHRTRRTATLVVARDRAPLDAQMAVLTWLLACGTGGTIAISFLVGMLIVRRGLAPLDRLAAEIAAIGQGDLSARVPARTLPAELVPVVERLNDLLRRLEEAFARERSFTSDAAHELRTPLAGLRSTIEVALARPRATGEYRDALSECLGIVQHTQTLAGQLLALARMESHQTVAARDAVPVADLVDTALRPAAGIFARRGLTLSVGIAPELSCTADRALLLTILSELVSNAAEYTEAGGRIDVTAAEGVGCVDLVIANSGCRLPPEAAAHVFDRFWRGDQSRSQTGVHAGLGLTLVRQAVSAIGGSVAVSIGSGTFAVRLRLPGQPSDGAVS
jgi:two-component system, OmpR family, heavy metal sensor histidine kinase CusS